MNAPIDYRDLDVNGAAVRQYRHALENLSTGRNKTLNELIKRTVEEAGENRRGLAAYERAISTGSVGYTSLLQTFDILYANEEYIGTKLLPINYSDSLTAKYKIRDKSKDLMISDDTIGTSGEANSIDVGLTEDSISLDKRALKQAIDMWAIQNMEPVIKNLIMGQDSVRQRLELAREKRIAALVSATASYGSNYQALSGSSQWLNNGGDPIRAVEAAKAALWSGLGPTKIIGFCSEDVYRELRTHTGLIGRYTNTPFLGRSQIADAFELDDLFVGRARYNTANSGAAGSYSRIWGTGIFGVLKVAQVPGLNNVAFGYTFQTQEETTSWFQEGIGGRGAQIVQVSRADQHKVTVPEAGYLFTGCC